MATVLKTPAGEAIPVSVFTLTIHQKEGLKALCDLEISPPKDFPLPEKIDVWMEGVCQFRGHVTGVLHHFTPQTSKIELTTVCAPYLPLPDEPIQFASPHEHLPVLPFYDRLTGEISEARLLQGKQTLTIDEKSILNYASTKQPASIGVDLCLEASWRWQRISFFDLWAEVAAQCSGEFATLTPDTFIQKWHAILRLSPQSGYQVVHNHLFIQKPRFSGVFGDKKRVKGGVIDGQCIIRATQEQKYHERVNCSFGTAFTQRKHLHLKVPLADFDETEFFTTPVGRLWFERAYAIAHNYFLACNRQTRITVEVVLSTDHFAQLTTDTNVVVGTRFSGKLIDYTITETAGGRLCRLVLCETKTDASPHIPTLPFTETQEEALPRSFVQDLDIQNLYPTQNACTLSHTTGVLTLPATTVYVQLRDLISKPIEPKEYRV